MSSNLNPNVKVCAYDGCGKSWVCHGQHVCKKFNLGSGPSKRSCYCAYHILSDKGWSRSGTLTARTGWLSKAETLEDLQVCYPNFQEVLKRYRRKMKP